VSARDCTAPIGAVSILSKRRSAGTGAIVCRDTTVGGRAILITYDDDDGSAVHDEIQEAAEV